MTDRDRLIELLKQIYFDFGEECVACIENGYKCQPLLEEFFADELIANGVIVPPVSVEQKVWYIKGGYYNARDKKPCEIEITEINHKRSGKTLDWAFIANGTRYKFSSIGKTVFLTKEEVEQALRERNNG